MTTTMTFNCCTSFKFNYGEHNVIVFFDKSLDHVIVGNMSVTINNFLLINKTTNLSAVNKVVLHSFISDHVRSIIWARNQSFRIPNCEVSHFIHSCKLHMSRHSQQCDKK